MTPARPGLVLSLKRLDRLLEHEPGDLTATAEAGLTFGAFQEALGRRGQWLSLDPPNARQGTLGGILASNASGPRRHLYGTMRDLLIGLTMVLADGSIVRGGGKVVKNVAGYDLPKLAIGSFGTLGILVEATFKLRPRPDTDRLALARFERVKDAGAAARALMASDLIPSALDLVDPEALRALEPGGREGAALLIGLDGIREQVEWQCAELPRILGTGARVDTRVLDGAERDALWQAAGALPRAVFPEVTAVMKWGVLPTQVAEVVESGGDVARRHGVTAAFSAHAGMGIVTAILGAGIVGSGGGGAVAATDGGVGAGRLARAGAGRGRACDARVGAAGGEGAGAGLGPARRSAPDHGPAQGRAGPARHSQPGPLRGRNLSAWRMTRRRRPSRGRSGCTGTTSRASTAAYTVASASPIARPSPFSAPRWIRRAAGSSSSSPWRRAASA